MLKLLESRPWPGNVRELENFIERLVVSSESDLLTLQEKTLFDCLGEGAWPVAEITVTVRLNYFYPLGPDYPVENLFRLVHEVCPDQESIEDLCRRTIVKIVVIILETQGYSHGFVINLRTPTVLCGSSCFTCFLIFLCDLCVLCGYLSLSCLTIFSA